MASTHMTPGVIIQEINAFPNSAVAVETAIPTFIGYTDIATRNGKSLVGEPIRITSFAEYTELFGAGFKARYTITDATDADKDAIVINGIKKKLKIADNHTFYMYNAIRLFYANGGGPAYIYPVGTYRDKPEGVEIKAEDFIGAANVPGVFDQLAKVPEITLVVIPDAIILGEACYGSVYQAVLDHCGKMQSRFAIFDLVKPSSNADTDKIVASFKDKIDNNFLSYGAVYYPWLNTIIVQPDEINFENFDSGIDLEAILPEDAAKATVSKFKAIENPTDNDKRNLHLSLKATSATYVNLLNEVRNKQNELPPSGAIAGIYTRVDNDRGVWRAPANISLNMVNAPNINISDAMQQNLNIDVMAGKSVNVIRPFTGVGTLVWGARTLDGNSQDWKYVNVRRTIIMIEQSIKLACRAYVFEPNDSNTWITVKSMIENFLTNLWKQGALSGASPEQAFDVQIGLGSTMTANDILDGYMNVTVKVAIVRPAEFIVITFQQQMQQS